MKFNFNLIVILILTINFSQQAKNKVSNPKSNILIMKNFLDEQHQALREEERKQMANELIREQEKEKIVRKIINDYLMPLTRGNSFMKDFYSGRY